MRFINLMINDVTYLMDESLNELTQIHNIEIEMEDAQEWGAKTPQYRREREGTLRSLERHASGYITLGRSTVDLLQVFTVETKRPFMMPEIVGKLAAMLDYNLEALAGPKCRDLKVKNPEKYKFNPRALLSDVVQIFLNLSDQEEFAKAVAEDGRSYKKELFEGTVDILRKRSLKTEDELQKLLAFVQKVEVFKVALQEEEDLGEVPDEFLGRSISYACFTTCLTDAWDHRFPHVHRHGRSRYSAVVACGCGQVYDKITFALGPEGSV